MRYPLFILSLCLLGCTEIFEGEFTSEGSDRIVITGGITNIEAPEVRVYNAVPFSDGSRAPQPIRGAHVWIEDQNSLRVEMEEANDTKERKFYFFAEPNPDPENFTTEEEYLEVFWDIDTLTETFDSNFRYEAIDKDFRGAVGSTYKLVVELENGTRYESTPQPLKAAPHIGNAYAEYEKGRSINDLGNEENAHRWNVFVETAVNPNEETFLNWRYSGVYEVETFPEEYCDQEDVDCNPGIAHPREVPPGCCKFCYVTEYGNEFATASSAESPSSQIKRQVAAVPVNSSKVYNYYQMDIYQLSISREVYDYLEVLNRQITGQGTIFDPTPATIEGNISNADNSNDKALGMFYAAGVTTTQLDLNRSGISTQFTPNYFPNDCRLTANSTAEKPEGYVSSKENLCYFYYTDSWNQCDLCYDMAKRQFSKCPE